MRRTAVAIIVALTLLIAGYAGKRSGLGVGNRADLLSWPPPTVASPDGPCNWQWPRQGNLTGWGPTVAVLCYTDDGSSMQFRNTSPFVLRVTSTSDYLTKWQVDRPSDTSWVTTAVNYTVRDDYDYRDNAALLVPGASLWADGAAPVTISFTILQTETAEAYGSKVLAEYAEKVSNRAKYGAHPGVALLQQAATCATAAYKVFDAYVSDNKEDMLVKLAEGFVPCAAFIQKVHKLLDDAPTPPASAGNQLVEIARVAKTSLLEDGLRLAAKAAVFVGEVR